MSQFLDVIQWESQNPALLIYKWARPSGNNEIKQGSSLIVRDGQAAAFFRGGNLVCIFKPGTYHLSTHNYPVLSTLLAFPSAFNSPLVSDIYFISLTDFTMKWGTKSPILKRDPEFGIVRVRAFGSYTLRVSDPVQFFLKLVGPRKMFFTMDIADYVLATLLESASVEISTNQARVVEMPSITSTIASHILSRSKEQLSAFGIDLTSVIIEGFPLPPEVEAALDQYAAANLMNHNRDAFQAYTQTVAMREAANNPDSGASQAVGLGLGLALGQQAMQVYQNPGQDQMITRLRELKTLFDEGILTEEEYLAQKKRILDL